MTKVLVLSSGGLDSTTALGMAINKYGYNNVETVSFDYGQRHNKELKCAEQIAKFYEIPNHLLQINLNQIGGSSLTDNKKSVPKGRNLHLMTMEIPNTWVPQRNTLFITMAHAFAEVRGFNEIWIGANQLDYSGYPDCRSTFFDSLQETLNRGSKAYCEKQKVIKIFAPLQFMNKKAIIHTGLSYAVPYHLTWSCYSGGEKACGQCDSCKLRLQGFKEIGKADPIQYEG